MNNQEMNVSEAFTKWASYSQEPCRCSKHANSKFEVDGFMVRPAPDDQVCEREKAWRRYVEIRDNRPKGWASEHRLRKYNRNFE